MATGLHPVCMQVHRPLPRHLFAACFSRLLVALLISGVSAHHLPGDPGLNLDQLEPGLYALLETERGPVLAELFFELAPLTTTNFVGLAEGTIPNSAREEGESFYRNMPFHRVVPGFIVQTGDPEGTGRGGPGYTFPDEFNPELRHGMMGILSMANEGPNTNGSQFFITLDDRQDRLNYKHSVFGRVVRGMETVQAIGEGDLLESVTILRVGEAARNFGTGATDWERRLAEYPRIPPASSPHPFFFDFAELEFPIWFPRWIAEKLYHYETVRGMTILLRTFRTFTPSVEQQSPGDFARQYLALVEGGADSRQAQSVLLLYFADTDSWHLRASRRLWPLLFPELPETDPASAEWDMLAAHVEERARAMFSDPNPRRLMDGMATQIILLLDGHWSSGGQNPPPAPP